MRARGLRGTSSRVPGVTYNGPPTRWRVHHDTPREGVLQPINLDGKLMELERGGDDGPQDTDPPPAS